MEGVGEYEYCTKDLIGHGAFAVVFKGRHKKNHNSVVAIKSITKKNISKSQNLLGKEIKILKELTELHHENVVALLDCKETPHHVYLVMEYCNGGDLADYLHAKGTLSEDTIRLFLRQLAGAMRALNAKGIVHRDLKPQNILLCHSGKQNPAPHEIRLKIADFGFARFLQEGVMAATLCGSPMYMAPEVIMSLQYDAKADLWSIGTIVFQCLTGKAPFQAQTPQALKLFYEKNVNLAPKIPAGTSPDLADLLLKLLKRNAKDRVEFDEFFVHPFLKKIIKSTSPVPVPSRQRSLPPECSPTFSRVLPDLQTTSPRIVPVGSVDVDEEMPQECQACSPSLSDNSRFSPVSKGSPGSNDEQEDFVLVPVNLPSDISPDGTTVQTNKRKSVDACSTSPASVRHQTTRMVAASPRPVYLPVTNSPGSTTGCSPPSPLYAPSEPIPVPSQKEAFQMIQQSLRDSDGSGSRDRDRHNSSPSPSGNSPRSPKAMQNAQTAVRTRTDSSESGACWANISSLSPPAVQFSMGTPPNVGGRRISSSGGSVVGTPPSPWGLGRMSPPPVLVGRHTPTGSPLRKSSIGNTNYFFHQPPLSPILASPCKPNTVGLNYNTLFAQLPPTSDAVTSPSQPLIVPFGNRAHTLPDISGNDFQTGGGTGNATGSEALFRRSGSAGKLGEKMKVAFAGANPLGACHVHPHFQFAGNSPPGSDGLVVFVAPELPEETLMEREHNETLAKLNFVSALVDCIVELARSRATPLAAIAESASDVNVASEGRRRAEQLVLYVRALQLLSSSLNLARDELKAVRLQPSNSVRNVVGSMNERYHQCLRMCKVLHGQNLLKATGVDPSASEITADRLIYNYAIEMCQSAALDELFGNPQECFRRYQTAQILLHSLAQQVVNDQDRQLLNKYKEAVEKRLYVLQQQGYIYAYDTT